MARPPAETLTGREAQIMDAIWRLGEATAEQVREAMPEPLHDSTVRTLLRVLESKGYLEHEARGKAYVYRAVVERTKAQRRALGSVLARFFGGSAEDLVLRLIEDERISPEQLDALRRRTPEPRGRRRPGNKRTGGQP
jgi:predicted transcriptional regulator